MKQRHIPVGVIFFGLLVIVMLVAIICGQGFNIGSIFSFTQNTDNSITYTTNITQETNQTVVVLAEDGDQSSGMSLAEAYDYFLLFLIIVGGFVALILAAAGFFYPRNY